MTIECIEVRSGLLVSVADDVELPDGMYRMVGETDEAPTPSKADLIAQAESLGIEVPSKANKAEIQALIDTYATKAVEKSEDEAENLPDGVAPGTPIE